MKALVISLAGIGDTLFATPLIHELRSNFPSAQIDALVFWPGARDLLIGNPHLNTIYQKDLVKAGAAKSLPYLLALRKNRYDISFNTHPQSRIHYRVVARVIGARLRASHRYECFGMLDRLLVNRTIPQDYSRHAIENNLELLQFAAAKPVLAEHGYEVFLSESDEKWAEEFAASRGLNGRVCMGFHVGSGGTKNLPLRRWPVENYVALIRRLTEARRDAAILLFGGPEEVEAHEAIRAQTDTRSVVQVESRNLRQTTAMLRKCHSFLSVDTALMHLAAAVKVPHQVVIEPPTWNKPIEPYGRPFTLVPNPAVAGRNLEYYRYDGKGIRGTADELRRCMESVTVDAVYEKMMQNI
jgi:ADP-heptose:LPS heptosyltransferase